MKYLTIDYIKQHSKIDYDCEDGLLELYGRSAEEAMLKILNRSLDDLKAANGGEVPASIEHATLIIIDNSYLHRSPAEVTNLSIVMYGIDMLIKPWMVL